MSAHRCLAKQPFGQKPRSFHKTLRTQSMIIFSLCSLCLCGTKNTALFNFSCMTREQPQENSLYRLPEFIFYSNYFYGLCAVALSIEAALQQRSPLNGWLYFCIVFFITVLYYSYPYIRKCSVISSNPRTNWYTRNYRFMWWQQVTITIILCVSLILFLADFWRAVAAMSARHWILATIFPFVAALYYGINAFSGKYSLRKIGWLKPFIIGFTWAGLVTVYPVLFYLSLAGLGTFIYYAVTHGFDPVKVLLNTIPFILLVIVAWSLRRRRAILYYLIVVDGLMLIKALCGTAAMLWF
jgi:hypothetical protein